MYGFSKKLLSSLICQQDGGNLNLSQVFKGDNNVISEGCLKCNKCNKEYYIKKGILHIFTEQNDIDSDLINEMNARDNNAYSYDERLSSRYDKEVIPTIKQLGKIEDADIIDYGCGTGRITTELSQARTVLAVDFSLESLLVFLGKLENSTNYGLVWADATQFVTKIDFFNKALSTQVLEHIPNEIKRFEWLMNISDTLKKEGKFVCSAYYQDIRRRIREQSVEGYHEKSDIFFHYFSKKEIKKEFNKIFKIKKIKIIDITIPLEIRLKLDKVFKGSVSRLLENIPIINSLGHLILVTVIKKYEQK